MNSFESLFTKNQFREWLTENQESRFRRRSTSLCPLAHFILSITGQEYASIAQETIIYGPKPDPRLIHQARRTTEDTPPWASAFMSSVDSEGKQAITGAEALVILEKLEERNNG